MSGSTARKNLSEAFDADRISTNNRQNNMDFVTERQPYERTRNGGGSISRLSYEEQEDQFGQNKYNFEDGIYPHRDDSAQVEDEYRKKSIDRSRYDDDAFRLRVLREENDNFRTELDQAKKTTAHFQHSLKQCQRANTEYFEANTRLAERVEDRDRRMKKLLTEQEDSKREVDHLVQRKQELERKLHTKERELDDSQQKSSSKFSNEERENLIRTIHSLEKQLKLIQNSDHHADQYQTKIDELNGRIERRDATIKQLERLLNKSEESFKELRQDYREVRNDHERLLSQYHEMKRQPVANDDRTSHSTSVRKQAFEN